MERIVKKNDIVRLEIEDMLPDGNGVGKINGYVIFVPRTCKGDIIDCRIIKVGVNKSYGKIERIITPSKDRIEIDCPAFKSCGGCVYRHISYDLEKEIKLNMVNQNFKRIGCINIECNEILSPKQIRYRGKAEYPCTLVDGHVKFGFYARGSHRVIPCADCLLQPIEYCKIVNCIETFCDKYKLEPYDEETRQGIIRHLYIRSGIETGDIMVCLVINNDYLGFEDELISSLISIELNIKSIVIDINKKDSNVILSNNYKVIYGKDYIEDILCGLKFKINPLSFFQVNHNGAEILYNKVKEYANPQKDDILLDLYCGTGTIGLTMANDVNTLYGVEIIEKAIENAKENAKENNINNSEFFCSDAGKAASKFIDEGLKPNIIIVDPPRSGCDNITLDSIMKMKPEKIVMVSCNSSTAARDCKILSENGYLVKNITAVDMFPRTGHVETVVLLGKENADDHIKISLDMSSLENNIGGHATYKEIKEYVKEHFDLNVSTLNIAQIKDKYEIIERDNYNLPKNQNTKIPNCTEEKERAIIETFKYYGMIDI